MHPALRRIQHDVSLGRQDNQGPSSAVMLLRKRDRRRVGSRNDDRLFLRLVHDLDAVPAFGDDPLYLVLRDVAAVEIVARRILYAVPEAAENDRTLRVSILK